MQPDHLLPGVIKLKRAAVVDVGAVNITFGALSNAAVLPGVGVCWIKILA